MKSLMSPVDDTKHIFRAGKRSEHRSSGAVVRCKPIIQRFIPTKNGCVACLYHHTMQDLQVILCS